MAHIIDVRASGGELVILGKALVIPSNSDNSEQPLEGSLRFNTGANTLETYVASPITGATAAEWRTIATDIAEVARANFAGLPASNAKAVWTAGIRTRFPQVFIGYGNVLTFPAGSMTITVHHNTTAVGNIAIDTSGVFTFTNTTGAPFVVEPGEYLRFTCPNTPDATAADLSIALVGIRI